MDGERPMAGEVEHDGDRRTPSVRLLVLAVVLVAALLGLSAPALALKQQGHSFASAFGAQGHGSGQLEEPEGVAVNEASGTVYVADRGNNRVQEFGLKGEPGKSIEVPYPTSIAVDNSTEASDPSKGDIYVVGITPAELKELQQEKTEPEVFLVYKFNSKGSLIQKIKKAKGKEVVEKEKETFEGEFELIRGVAVDTHGSLFISDEEEIFEFSNASKSKAIRHVESEGGEAREGLAVDSEDNLYSGVESPEGASTLEEELTEENELEDKASGLLVEGLFEFGVVSKISGATGAVEVPELDPEFSTAVAIDTATEAVNGVNEAGDVFITNVSGSAAKPVSSIAAFGPHHELLQRFAPPGGGGGYFDGIAVDSKTGAVYVADRTGDKIDVFGREEAAPPTVTGLTACTLGGGPGCPGVAGVAKLSAEVDPNGEDTEYHFEYGPAACSTEPSPCTSTPEKAAGKGFEDEQVGEQLEGLAAGTYHYRIVAKNALGKASEEHTFTILSATAGLADNRQWELVSPPQKEGNEPEPMSSAGSMLRASENGQAITYAADGPMGEGVEGARNPEYAQLVSTRGSSEWSTRDVTTPNDRGTGIAPGKVPEYADFSPDLALALVEPYPGYARAENVEFAAPPLAPPVSEHEVKLATAGQEYLENTMYLRANPPLQPQASEAANFQQALENGHERAKETGSAGPGTGYVSLINEANAPAVPFGGGSEAAKNKGVEFTQVATPDLSHGVFKSRLAAPGAYEWGPGGHNQLVSELPEAPAVSCGLSTTLKVIVEKATAGTVQYKFTVDDDLKYETPAINYNATAAEVAKAFEEASATNGLGEKVTLPAGAFVASGGPLNTSEVVLTLQNSAVGPFGALEAVQTALVGTEKKAKLKDTGCLAVGAEEVAVGGFEENTQRNAISKDGTRIILTAGSPSHLYVRDTTTGETLQLDHAQGITEGGGANAMFAAANSDDSKVFFTDTQRLTPESKATELAPDLYVAELSGGEAAAEPLVLKLTDLTPAGNAGESADVPADGRRNGGGGVLGASEDGSYVYFTASGALAPGATRATCYNLEEGTCNLYVRHYSEGAWQPTQLIAVLSGEDSADWGIDPGGSGFELADLSYMSSRVSPNGAYLAFMSERSLTGYDNEDRTSHEPDEEVYLYSAASGNLVCASCNPTGERPAGVFDEVPRVGVVQEGGEGVGLVVDRPGVWNEHWLGASLPGWTPLNLKKSTYQSRYLSNDGRLFFNSPDTLVPAVEHEVKVEHKTSKEKVYEYEPNGLGSCTSGAGCISLISKAPATHESAFLDASANGNDVFFLTSEKLTPLDIDESFDVYDAHVCEAASPCLPEPAGAEPPCESVEECHGGSPPGSAYQAPASTRASSGNPAPKAQTLGEKGSEPPTPKLTLTQQLEKALKACKANKNAGKRATCEKQARAKYGPLIRAQNLAKALKACKKDSRSKRKACEAAARKRYGPQHAKKATRGTASRRGR